MKKVAVVGSRTFKDFKLLEKEITNIIKINDISEIVSGGAKGADRVGRSFATIHKLSLKEFIPNWKVNGVYNSRAGFERNNLIIERADIVFAFWNGESRGTKNSIDLAKKLGKELHVIYFEEVSYTKEELEVFKQRDKMIGL